MLVVTGGAGFIGSVLLGRVNAEGLGARDVVVVDRLGSSGKWRNLSGKAYREILTPEEFLASFDAGARYDAVVHLGACSSTTVRDADYVYRNNIDYSRKLALRCAEAGTRFVYASSASTYGDGRDGFDDGRAGIDRYRPRNLYGWSKQEVDLWAEREGILDAAAGLKFFNVYGPNEYHKGSQASAVYNLYPALLETGKVRLFRSARPDCGDGEQRRDFVYVKDCADVVWWLLGNKVGGLFNVGSGTASSFNDVASAMCRAAGVPTRIEYVDMPDSIKNHYQYYTLGGVGALTARGYPGRMTELSDGVGEYVGRYLSADPAFPEVA